MKRLVLFPSARRRDIATSDPVAREMWRQGASLGAIAQALGISQGSAGKYFGVADPQVADPVPPHVPPQEWRVGESDEARVWRRFPITGHKPGRA